MLTTIEVEIDQDGRVRPLEPPPCPLQGRAYLTLLPDPSARRTAPPAARGTAADALALLASPRFAQRPVSDPSEVQRWLASDDRIFDRASRLRAGYGLKTPDALHLATALHYGCDEFWTNDGRLKLAAGGIAVDVLGGSAEAMEP